MARRLPLLAITYGEPAGIGPEIALRAAWLKRGECYPVLIGDIEFLRNLAYQIDPVMVLNSVADFSQLPSPSENTLTVLHVPLACPVIAGQTDARNGLGCIG